jgi:hypothetical protein
LSFTGDSHSASARMPGMRMIGFSPLQWPRHESQAAITCAHLGSRTLASTTSQHAMMHSSGTWVCHGVLDGTM